MSDLKPKDSTIVRLLANDIKVKEVARVVNMHPDSISRKKKQLQRLIISNDLKLAKKGKKALHDIVDDFMSENNKNTRSSDIIKINELIQSRIDPVINYSKSENVNINVSPVLDMSPFDGSKKNE